MHMASAAPVLPVSPDFQGVTVRPGSVIANPVRADTSNACLSLTLPDQTQFDAYVSGLRAQGTLFDISGPLTVRFFIRGNH
jgi:hypothetical protein